MNTYEKIRLLAGKMGLSQDPDIRRMYAEQIAKLQGNENTLSDKDMTNPRKGIYKSKK